MCDRPDVCSNALGPHPIFCLLFTPFDESFACVHARCRWCAPSNDYVMSGAKIIRKGDPGMHTTLPHTSDTNSKPSLGARSHHWVRGASGAAGGGLCAARLDDGRATGRTARAHGRTAWHVRALVYRRSELLAAVGLILPGMTRILPFLTAWAAAGLMIVMSSATVLHLYRSEWSRALVAAVLCVLVTLVAYARWESTPFATRP